MKNKIYVGLVMIALTIMTACDNGNTDVDIIDSTPTVTIGGISGNIEGETLTVQVTAEDGAETSSEVSELATLQWSFTNNGGSGSASLTGNSYVGVITQAGMTAGDYVLTVTVVDTNGNSSSESVDVSIIAALPDITGAWTLSNEDNAYFVGDAGTGDYWWGIRTDTGLADRACQMDDVWTFGSDGKYTLGTDGQTWLEGWQAGTDECNAPVAPFVDGTYDYSFDGTTLTVSGTGAFIGLAKVTNTGELGNQLGATDYPSSVAYEVVEITDTTMQLRVVFDQAGGPSVYWVFNLKRQ